ncbi:uncharacterized protein EMH_0099910 [Eimeria mitis]|uniref:Uncharacterized protein n=1 Tax=Eimeria mitis TaxID=44415 RepID=U6KFX1_9EIME|nr:uncharacterized protein EMH_0099910 [Eimeria mitis]CDJ35696.1 hypothetical protein EMH_0099910 [Eimeria mitis]
MVLASAAASAVAVQQLLEPEALRLLQLDAAVLLRPSAVHDALLQLLLCCPASSLFVLPAAAIEELQELLLDQGASVLQLLRISRMLLYKFFADHPFSYLALDARAVAAAGSDSKDGSSSSNSSSNNSSSSSSKDHAAAATGAANAAGVAAAAAASNSKADLEVVERRLALLAAAVLTPQQEEVLLQQMAKFRLLHAHIGGILQVYLQQQTSSSS